jgi:hypothetical protein
MASPASAYKAEAGIGMYCAAPGGSHSRRIVASPPAS